MTRVAVTHRRKQGAGRRCRSALAAPLLLAAALAAPGAGAQSVVREVPRPRTPFVMPFSACRQAAPAEPVAQRFYAALTGGEPFRQVLRQVDAIRAQPPEALQPIDAEVYFQLLRLMEFRLGFEPASAATGVDAILAARRDGQPLAERFGADPRVQCSWAVSEHWLMQSYRLRERFEPGLRQQARDRLVALYERALAGAGVPDAPPAALRATLGQLLLDRSLERLPDAAAEPDLAAGASQLLQAAASTDDERELGNWTRYAFVLGKLPPARQDALLQRLLAEAEAPGGWAAREPLTPAALQAWLHLLDGSAGVARALGRPERVAALYERHLRAVQAWRAQAPDDPNAQVQQVLALLRLADAMTASGRTAEARGRLAEAERLEASAGAAARDMLAAQDFGPQRDALRRRLR